MKLTVLFGLMIYWSIIITAPVISKNSEKFGETIDILTNNKLGKIEWIEYRNLKDGWGAFKEIHDGTCSAPKIVLLP